MTIFADQSRDLHTDDAVLSADELEAICSGMTALSIEHETLLASHAIPVTVAFAHGVRSAINVDDLPTWAQFDAEIDSSVLPALVVPFDPRDGDAASQVVFASGRSAVALLGGTDEADHPNLFELRRVDQPSRVVIVEGILPALSLLAAAPDDWSVLVTPRLDSWRDSAPEVPSSLSCVAGRTVVIVPDGDPQVDIRTHDGAVALGKACETEGASPIRFARTPGAGRGGLSVVLGREVDSATRRARVSSWIGAAKPHPAEIGAVALRRMREALERQERLAAFARDSGDRVPVDISRDPLEVRDQLFELMAARLGGKTVFRMNGGVVYLQAGDTGNLYAEVLDDVATQAVLLEEAACFAVAKTAPEACLIPDRILPLIRKRQSELPVLRAITNSPIVRADGTVALKSGYDEATEMYLDLSSDVDGVVVPEHPTDDDLAAAVRLIRDDLLAMDGADGYDGFIFASPTDQTNAVAALLTPMVRALTPTAPIFVFDGIQPGSGKNALVEVISRVAFGMDAPVTACPSSDVEMSKSLVALLAEGRAQIVLDEIQDQDSGRCRINAKSLGAVLTAPRSTGRILGKTKISDVPNAATFYAMGNNVQMAGDIVRRSVPVRFSSDRVGLEYRSNFRHNLDGWVRGNRASLLGACLTLIRAWFDRGQPTAPLPVSLASFTEWQRILGGILQVAGFQGFLANIQETRMNADRSVIENLEFLEWVDDEYPNGKPFSLGNLIARADAETPAPHGHEWADLTAKSLSAWVRTNPQWWGGLRIRPCATQPTVSGGAKAYVIERAEGFVSSRAAARAQRNAAGAAALAPLEQTAAATAAARVRMYEEQLGHQAARHISESHNGFFKWNTCETCDELALKYAEANGQVDEQPDGSRLATFTALGEGDATVIVSLGSSPSATADIDSH